MKRAALRVGRCAGESTASSLRMQPTVWIPAPPIQTRVFMDARTSLSQIFRQPSSRLREIAGVQQSWQRLVWPVPPTACSSEVMRVAMAPTSASKRSTVQELHRMIWHDVAARRRGVTRLDWRPQRTSAAAEEEGICAEIKVAGADGKKYMKCKSGVRLTDRRQILEPGVCRRSYVRLGSVGWRSGASSVVGSIRRLKRSAQDRRRKYVMIWPPHVDSMLACLCFCFPPAAAFASSGCASSGCAPVGEPAVACTVALWFQLVAEPT